MSSINIAIDQINEAASIIVLVLSFISVVPGGIGLIFNIIVFTRPSLRHEPSVTFNIDTANYNLGICKIEYFALYVARAISNWLIVLASIDRFCHSSSIVYIRRMSSLKIARIAIGIISLTIILSHSHMIVYYEINNITDRFGNIAPSCSGQKGIYRTFLGFSHMILYSFCPSFFMCVFGFLTLNNLRQHRHVVPVSSEIRCIARRTDTQLLRMLTAQVLVIILSTLPFSINQLYTSFTSTIVKNTFQIAQDNLVARTVGTMTYFAHSTSFYLYTLTGTIFRKELSRIIERCWHFIEHLVHMNHVETHQILMLQGNRQIVHAHNNIRRRPNI